ncbi:T5orf172 domain-containing protein [Rhizobium subbaraonis]|uniref:T5orf172 domain-containing protein n=1 Tax=Rhizobium subbaraonis TaxID=908946 RepID=A0A285UVC0_9HYPH|nr:GIY-YIG nuclease family protein [Rhizobium subbaraonis]SOC45733.1 T5orf172 domain-containing protein [Rhizobium subbaraonis]
MTTKGQHIYFMRPVGMVGPIKIGCSASVGERLESLAVWSPFKLEILYTEPGGYKLEQKIHQAFADYHSHREWFHPGERLLASIGRLLNGEKIEAAIDLTVPRGSIRNVARKPRRPVPEYQKELRSYRSRKYWAEKRVEKARGQAMFAPESINAIIYAWEGSWREKRMDGKRPTPEQFALLDDFLADPHKYCLTREEKWPKRTAA